MFVAVRAIAPVAGRPPTIGDTMLATPWATSSTFGLWRSPPSLSATTADISDSMAPSIATVNAGEKGRYEIGSERRHVDRRQPSRDAAKSRADRLDADAEHGDRGRAAGERENVRRHSWDNADCHDHADQRHRCQGRRGGRRGPRVRCEHAQSCDELSGNTGYLKAEEITDLRARDHQGDAVGKADDDRSWNEAYGRAKAE